MICKKCGAKLDRGVRICPSCGYPAGGVSKGGERIMRQEPYPVPPEPNETSGSGGANGEKYMQQIYKMQRENSRMIKKLQRTAAVLAVLAVVSAVCAAGAAALGLRNSGDRERMDPAAAGTGSQPDFDGQTGEPELTEVKVSLPDKTEYVIGEPLDSDGLKVEAVYGDGSVLDVTGTAKMSADSPFNEPGEREISITYEEMTVSFTVTVLEDDLRPTDIQEPTDAPEPEPTVAGMPENTAEPTPASGNQWDVPEDDEDSDESLTLDRMNTREGDQENGGQ